MAVSVISAREERLMVKPPNANPFRQIWRAFKKMPKAFIRTIASFLLAFVATYQCQAAFSGDHEWQQRRRRRQRNEQEVPRGRLMVNDAQRYEQRCSAHLRFLQ